MRAFVELRQAVAARPEYELLKEKVRRIEATLLVENQSMTTKMRQLSLEVGRFSQVLDQFQEAYIVIKRPGID